VSATPPERPAREDHCGRVMDSGATEPATEALSQRCRRRRRCCCCCCGTAQACDALGQLINTSVREHVFFHSEKHVKNVFKMANGFSAIQLTNMFQIDTAERTRGHSL